MDEARRILRFVMPGSLFGLLWLLTSWLLVPGWLEEARHHDLIKDFGAGHAVVIVLGIGALGYVFSAMHHQLNWWLLPRGGARIIRSEFAKRMLLAQPPLIAARRLNRAGGLDDVTNLGPIEGDALVIGLWHQQLGTDPIKSAEPKLQALVDTAHSAGSAAIAALFGFSVAWVHAGIVGVFQFELWAGVRFALALFMGVGSVVLFWTTFRRVGDLADRISENILLKALFSGKDPVSGRELVPGKDSIEVLLTYDR